MAGYLKGLRPPALILWMSLCALLGLGLLSTLFDYGHVSRTESLRANAVGQRAIVDPMSGNVSLGAPKEDAFDVAKEEPKPEPAPEPVAAAPEAAPETPKPEALAPEAPATPVATAPAEPITAPVEQAAASAQAASKLDLQNMPMLRTEPLKTALPAITASNGSLIPAPAPEVTEKGDMPLPKRGLNDATPSNVYAQHFTHGEKENLLSILVLNAGMNAQSDSLILNLPKEVSVAFSPYGRDTKTSLAALRRAGYETWGMLPAMGEHFPQEDPGPLGLVTSLPKDELLRRVREVMSSTLGAVGLVLPPNETLTTKPQVFGNILTEIDARGMYLFGTNPARAPQDATRDAKLKLAARNADLILDATPDEGQINSKLASIDELMQKKGALVLVVTARPQSLLLLQRWLKEHPLAAPVKLAPLSAQWAPPVAPVVEKAEGGGHGAPAEAKPAEAKKPEASGHGAPEKKGH